MLIFDFEANSLNPDIIHVMSYTKGGEVHSTSDYNEMRQVIKSSKVLIGHNIWMYDIPYCINKILGVDVPDKIIFDTMLVGNYLYPYITSHSLEAYGKILGVSKVEVNDWEDGEFKLYKIRCERDVEITKRLYHSELSKMKLLYGKSDFSHVLRYISFKGYCIYNQINNCFTLDVISTTNTIKKLSLEYEIKVRELLRILPPIYKRKEAYKKLRKSDGTISSNGIKWRRLVKKHLNRDDFEDVKYIDIPTNPNPNSTKQIKDYLFSLGWKPCTYKISEKGTKVPQILTQNKTLTKSILKLSKKHPEILVIEGIGTISNRINTLKGFINEVDYDGRISQSVLGFTKTMRFRHTKLVNLPKVTGDLSYRDGVHIRSHLTASDGHLLIGCDMKSLEDTTKQHYIYKYDRALVEEMQSPLYEPHLSLALFTGAISEDDYKKYMLLTKQDNINGDDNEFINKIQKIRYVYKQVNYSCVYGIGSKTLSSNIGCSNNEAKKLIEAYWEKNKAVKEASRDFKKKKVGKHTYVFNPISKMWLYLSNEKDTFSAVNQSTGAYCFDTFLMYVTKMIKPPVAQFHDELILEVNKENIDKTISLMNVAINNTNKAIKLNVELKIDIKVGQKYNEVH